jgi:hypothetical protein
MSTTPGDSTWIDAGLLPPDSPEDRADQEAEIDEAPELPEELPADAPEADVLDQHLDAGGLPPVPPRRGDRPVDDAAEHDLLDQALDVPVDDDDYPAE